MQGWRSDGLGLWVVLFLSPRSGAERFRSQRPLGLTGGGAERVTRQLPPGINSGGSAAPAADTSRDPHALSHAAEPRHAVSDPPARHSLRHAWTETLGPALTSHALFSRLLKVPASHRGLPGPSPPAVGSPWLPLHPSQLCPLHPTTPTPMPSQSAVQVPSDVCVCSAAQVVPTHPLLSFQMARGSLVLLVWLLLVATLSATLGLGMPVSTDSRPIKRAKGVRPEDQPGTKDGSLSPWWGAGACP